MMAPMSFACALVLLVAGCASAPPPPAPSAPVGNGAEAAPRAAALPAPRLALAAITVTFDGQPIARLRPDGRSESVGTNPPGSPMQPGPTLRADGTITFAAPGVTAHLGANGDLRLRSNDSDELFAHVTGDTLTFASTPRDSIRLDGDILRLPGGADRNRVIGATTPALRRTTLVLTAVFFLAPALAPPP